METKLLAGALGIVMTILISVVGWVWVSTNSQIIDVRAASMSHSERIARVEENGSATERSLKRIEDKLDRLIERRQ